jgi:hypothetical protein
VSCKTLLLFAATSVIWGGTFLFIRVAVEHLPPSAVVFDRTLLGAGFLVLLALRSRAFRGMGRVIVPIVVVTVLDMAALAVIAALLGSGFKALLYTIGDYCDPGLARPALALAPTGRVPGLYGRAWRMRFMGVWAARPNRLYPACSNTSRSRASPAWAPRPNATSWDSELGVQMAEDAV